MKRTASLLIDRLSSICAIRCCCCSGRRKPFPLSPLRRDLVRRDAFGITRVAFLSPLAAPFLKDLVSLVFAATRCLCAACSGSGSQTKFEAQQRGDGVASRGGIDRQGEGVFDPPPSGEGQVLGVGGSSATPANGQGQPKTDPLGAVRLQGIPWDCARKRSLVVVRCNMWKQQTSSAINVRPRDDPRTLSSIFPNQGAGAPDIPCKLSALDCRSCVEHCSDVVRCISGDK